MIASAYTDNQTKIGCIFGTGCNAAYMEEMGCIPKLEHMKLDPNLQIAINCEWGAFDNECVVLPRTAYDKHIDDIVDVVKQWQSAKTTTYGLQEDGIRAIFPPFP